MRTSTMGAFALLNAYFAYGLKAELVKVGADDSVPEIEGNTVFWKEGKYDKSFRCREDTPYLLPGKRQATCCPVDTSLKGSAETEWHCCATGHDVAGSKDVGFQCCVEGLTFDGTECKKKPPVVDPVADPVVDPAECESGVKTGKCYYLTGSTGKHLTFNRNQYSQTALGKFVRPAKLQFCQDEACTPGLPVNPSTQFAIKDLHGAVDTGKGGGQWLDDSKNGRHIGRTPKYEKAGKFSMTKWPCGKYCLTGFDAGLSQACPNTNPGITQRPINPDACIEFELLEVPCDIRADKNNCIWKSSKNPCCGGAIDCSSGRGSTYGQNRAAIADDDEDDDEDIADEL